MSSLLNVAAAAAGVGETEDEQKIRFQVELEFVQCLANPNYLNFLAQRDYFKNPTFINYLKYLLYWKRPEYAKFLKYPQSLTFLELLQSEKFREAIANVQNTKFIEDQLILQWQYYVRKRMRLQTLPEPETDGQNPPSAQPPVTSANH